MAEDGEPAVHGYCVGASVYITDADTYFKDYVQHNDKSFNIGVEMRKSDELVIVSTVAAMKEK